MPKSHLAVPRSQIRLIAAALLTLSACASAPVEPPPDLGTRLTYSWADDIQLPPRLGTRERLRRVDRIIRDGVDQELARRGYQQIASGSTDMIVLYEVILDEKQPWSLSDYADYRSRGGGASASKILGGYTEGTLVIEILDGFNHQLVWQSSATAIPDPGSQGERLPEIVRQIMAPLPRR
jgi:hypothetical protein